ncbi:HD domain-containing protein [Candidatus Bathyarchaeota archaeon]|nr:HD domain-containing protein [Candidatus Bathyarchaeota archaeon]
MKFSSSLRDPVYGVVPITAVEQEILKLPIMNRLKNIKQLGLAYLAFPGANHTRFEHSVGAMHVASLMATAVELDEHHTETIRIAALLHDVGHPPFSHSIEFACNMFGISEIPNHKKTTFQIIATDKELNKILKKAKPLVHTKNIAKLAVGTFEESVTLKRIIDGPIDADKIDYILRDNHHCGFPVALDINTISEILKKDENYGIAITPEGQSFAEQLFMGRYHLISKIHHNLKNRLGNYLLALTLEEA